MFSILLIISVIGQTLSSPSSRIIGGTPADIEDFPYQCSLRYSGSHTCGCVILSPSKVLTAAHCVDKRTDSLFSVYAGSTNKSSDGVLKSVLKVTQHENYNDGSGTFANDIAVISLTSEFVYSSTIQPGDIAHDNLNDFEDESCILTGWGRTSSSPDLPDDLVQVRTTALSLSDLPDDLVQVRTTALSLSDLPDDLVQVRTTALSLSECRSAMSGISSLNIQHMHLCVLSAGQDGGSCNGDSGGPMLCAGKIAGVTSWGISSGDNCLTTYPSVYTRVSNYYDWISSK